jgi:uncharacterized delta-60 repeat protein
MKKSIFIPLLFIFLQCIQAQTGYKMDNTFGINGHAIFGQEEVNLFANKLLQFKLNEGYIVAGGYTDNLLLENGFIFIRYDNQGKIDTTFGDKGVLKYPVVDIAFEEIVQIRDASDKSCLVLLRGTNEMSSDTSGIVCFTSNGKWVTDFGEGGILFSKASDIQDFDILPDNKILTLVNIEAGFFLRNAFERYTQLGILDKSYGKDGIAQFNSGFQIFNKMEKSGANYLCTGLDVDISTFNFNICAAKVAPNGSKVSSFGTIGIAKLPTFPSTTTDGLSIAVASKPLADGSLMILGLYSPIDTTSSEATIYFLSKINANGTFNTDFGNGGYLSIPIAEATQVFGIDFIELNNKKILLSKSIQDDALGALYTTLEIFSAEGELDAKFGNNGITTFNVNNEPSVTLNVVQRSNGTVAFSGLFFNTATQLTEAFISSIEFINTIATKENNSTISGLLVFPNPVKDNITLNYELSETTSISVELFDASGKMIQQLLPSQERSLGKQQESLPIDAHLPAGQYLLRVNMGEKGNKTIQLNKI